VRRVLVTDPDGKLVGIVATADLLRHADAIGGDRNTSILARLSEPLMIER
jgi:CBS domain-containing protein